MVNVINSNNEEDSSNNATEQDIAAFRPQQRQQQQRYGPQHNSNYRNNQNQQQKGKQYKSSYPKKQHYNPQSNSGNSGNGKFCAYYKILNHSQEECRKRMRDNKPCVNNQGKLYWPKINSAAENNDPNNVGAVFQ